jgi:sugar lactone lactonase YvrE
MPRAELVADTRAILGEGPWWDARARVLYWIDIRGKSLHCFDPSTRIDRLVGLGKVPGTVVGRKDAKDDSHGLLMAMEDGFYFIDPSTGDSVWLLDPEADRQGNRFNDGKCDERGRFWAGSMDDSEEANSGAFYRLDPDLGCERVLDGIGISNGLAWSPEGSTMYYIDSPTRRVDAFDFDADSGRLSGRRVAFELPAGLGFPDGMTIDEEGMLWIALWMGWGLGRWDPRSGKLLLKLEVPVARVTSCAFGTLPGMGGEMECLFITTASVGLGPEEHRLQPFAGGLFAYDAGLRGAASIPFAG